MQVRRNVYFTMNEKLILPTTMYTTHVNYFINAIYNTYPMDHYS